jgi:hypothetical protein
MDFVTASFLVFSFAKTAESPAEANRYIQFRSQYECVVASEQYKQSFARSFPGGIFVGHCKDAEGRTFFISRYRGLRPMTQSSEQ